MPISDESKQNFLNNYDLSIERQYLEWRRDADNPHKDPSEWKATMCFNEGGGNKKDFRSIDYYMLLSDAVLEVLLSADLFSDEHSRLVRGWMKSGKVKNEEVTAILKTKIKSNRYHRIKLILTSDKVKKPATLSKKDKYLMAALAAYVDEYRTRIITFYGHYYSPPVDEEIPNFFQLDLDTLFHTATLSGIVDEFPKLAYHGKVEYRNDEVYINFLKDKEPTYPSLNLSLDSDSASLVKKDLIEGSMKMSIPTANSRVIAKVLLYTGTNISAPVKPFNQLESRQILQKLYLTRNRFQSTTNPQSTSTEILETAGYDISFLEEFIGTYFGYRRTDKKTFELFVFRLHHHYYGILEHSNLLKSTKKYYCTITPISKPYQRIEISVLHSNNTDPLLKFYINVGKEEIFEKEKIFTTQFKDEYPSSTDIILQKLSDKPKIRKSYIKSAIMKEQEMTDFQDLAILNKLIPVDDE